MKFDSRENSATAGIMLRLKALVFDWLFICAYLVLLLLLSLAGYLLLFRGIPELSNLQSQLLASFTSVVPIILIFSVMEGTKNFASWGKRKVSLSVVFQGNPLKGSLVRNALKFLPWQCGHISTIHGMYNGFDSLLSLVFLFLSMALSSVYILMVLIRKDHRHFADILAGSVVVGDIKSG